MSSSLYITYKAVGFWARKVWAIVFLEHLVYVVEDWVKQHEDDQNVAWLKDCLDTWESDLYYIDDGFHLDEDWSEKELEIILSLIDKSYPLLKKGSSEEMGEWEVEPVIELTCAIQSLLSGTYLESPREGWTKEKEAQHSAFIKSQSRINLKNDPGVRFLIFSLLLIGTCGFYLYYLVYKSLRENLVKEQDPKQEVIQDSSEQKTPSIEIISQGGFQFLRNATYSCGGVTNTIEEYQHEQTGMEFAMIPAGRFMMGSEEGRHNEKPVHEVEITPFFMAKYEVTQAIWQKFMETAPWQGWINIKEGNNYPATYVNWNNCQEFCQKTGLSLPSESQWEYACRAGTSSKYYFGDSESSLEDYAWYDKNASNIGETFSHEVGEKKTNAFGLHDMLGNVWEWSEDKYEKYNARTETDPIRTTGSLCVLRGGSWFDSADVLRATCRFSYLSGHCSANVGFRLSASKNAL